MKPLAALLLSLYSLSTSALGEYHGVKGSGNRDKASACEQSQSMARDDADANMRYLQVTQGTRPRASVSGCNCSYSMQSWTCEVEWDLE